MTPRLFMRTASLMHLALMAGPLVVGLLMYFLLETWEFYTDTEDVFFLVVPFLAVCGVLAGNFVFKQKLHSFRSETSLRAKLVQWQTASIIRYALVEAPTFLAVIAAVITTNLYYFLLAALLLVYFLTLRPNRSKIEKELNVSREQRNQFSRLDEVVD